MVNWGGAGAGAIAGAGAGSAVLPGVGTAVGAGLGGLIGLLSGGKTKDQYKQLPTFSPQQQQLQNNLLGQLNQSGQPGGNYALSQDYFNRILQGDQGAYDQFAAPYLQNFQQQIIPRLAEQFGSLGGGLGGGVAGSSGFGQAIGGAGAQLQGNLASLFANLQNQAAQSSQGNYQNMASLGLGNRSFENLYQPGQIGLGGQIAAGAGRGFGQNLGMNLGNQFSNLFGGNGNNKATGTDFPTQA
jgi:hypothetical protein